VRENHRHWRCEMCDKQFYNNDAYDEHLNSYGHQHKKRLAELRVMERARGRDERVAKEKRAERKQQARDFARFAAVTAQAKAKAAAAAAAEAAQAAQRQQQQRRQQAAAAAAAAAAASTAQAMVPPTTTTTTTTAAASAGLVRGGLLGRGARGRGRSSAAIKAARRGCGMPAHAPCRQTDMQPLMTMVVVVVVVVVVMMTTRSPRRCMCRPTPPACLAGLPDRGVVSVGACHV
jgi:cobalamin biosynthesis Mg chelatase CobN